MKNFVKIGKKIIAIGRNYSEHAKELGSAVPKSPFFFLKPTTSYINDGESIEIPKGAVVHHEVELGVVIGKEGRDISAKDADDHIAGYALAVDVTARNLQNEAKDQGLPWSTSKGYDTFTPIGELIAKSKLPNASNVGLWLKVDGQLKQNGNTKDMIFDIPTIIEHVSGIMRLEVGDVILTGTPSGVGPIVPGQTVTCGVQWNGKDLQTLRFPVVARPRKSKI